MSKWNQRGHVVVSMTPVGMPLFHGFHLTEWEANLQFDEVMKMPEELRQGLTCVPAMLSYELPEPQPEKP